METKIVKMLEKLILFPLFGLAMARTYPFDEYELTTDQEWVQWNAKALQATWLITITAILRQFFKNYKIPINLYALIMLGSFAYGCAAYYHKPVKDTISLIYTSPQMVIYLYQPILVFSSAFCIDGLIFYKSLYQILIIGIPIFLATAAGFGLTMRIFIDTGWSLEEGLLFGAFCSPIYAANIVHHLKVQKLAKTRQMSALLESEALCSLIMLDIIQKLIVNYQLKLVVHWYSFLLLLVRFLVLGSITGLILAMIGRFMMRRFYAYPKIAISFLLSYPFFSYYFDEDVGSGCGSIALAIVGIVMTNECHSLHDEVRALFTHCNQAFCLILDSILCSTTAAFGATEFVGETCLFTYMMILVMYFMFYPIRFICFVIFLPLFRRVGYNVDFDKLLVCVLTGIKGPVGLIMVQMMLEIDLLDGPKGKEFFMQILGFNFLCLLINGSMLTYLMDFLGLRTVTLARMLNMSNCIKHVLAKRNQTIAVLKMDRFLADTNWSLVMQATTIRHPYKSQVDKAGTGEELDFIDTNYTNCPECHNEIEVTPTHQELIEIEKETRMRIMKVKKISYNRQFESGMISKAAYQSLIHAIENALSGGEIQVDIATVYDNFIKENIISKRIRTGIFEPNLPKDNIRLSHRHKFVRRFFYNIVFSKFWEPFMLLMVSIHMAVIIFSVFYSGIFMNPYIKNEIYLSAIVHIAKTFFVCLYLLEMLAKIVALATSKIWQGVQRYFRSFWNRSDFVVSIICLTELLHNLLTTDRNIFAQVLLALTFLRVVRLVRLAELCYPLITKNIDKKIDIKMAFAYEVCKSYGIAENEVLDILPHIVDNKEIRYRLKRKSEHDKAIAARILGRIQKERPSVAITVKSKQAMRTILKNMKDSILHLKVAGWVEAHEQIQLDNALAKLFQRVNAMKMVEPNTPKAIVQELSWIADDKILSNFLCENVVVRKFEPGDVVFDVGTIADGIYIVVNGMLVINYTPTPVMLDDLYDFGILPVVDYLTHADTSEFHTDFIVSGNTIGELSVLTNRPYDCTVTADAHTQVYVMSRNVLQNAMEISPDPVLGLKCKIWRELCRFRAITILQQTPAYQHLNTDQIKYILEPAFVPDLSIFKIFVVNELIQDVVLMQGICLDFNNREKFIAPICLPRTVDKLILPASSAMNLECPVETIFLVIPEKDVDGYDVMLLAEKTCELVPSATTRCLKHFVRHRMSRRQFQERKSTRGGGIQQFQARRTSNKVQPAEDNGTMFFKNVLSETRSPYRMTTETKVL